MSTLTVATVKSNSSSPPVFQNTSGTEVGTLCRAWVNFDGTGVIAIRAQFNVSSITDNGTGDYTVNFTTALADANYSVVATHEEVNGTAYGWAGPTSSGSATSSCRINTPNAGGNSNDRSVICVSIFR